MTKCLLLCVFLLLFYFDIQSQETKQDLDKRSYTTTRVSESPPEIDGLELDPAWDLVEWSGEFVQRMPDDGASPTEQTAFKILYDDKHLYVLVRAFDSSPDEIVKRMSRRDGFAGDWVEINIDSYADKRTAFSFTASVTGVKSDEYISNNGDSWDSNWDPIWYLKTSVDAQGWLAEFKIPLSQLRFADKSEHTWGIQFTRRFFRNEERSNWQYIPQDAAGWVHLFGELKGITGIRPQKQVEIQPYVVGKLERFKREDNNPFATGRESDINAGVDGKIGLTSDVTLDFTINPDFGQVEADPSQLNLSAFQIFFRERRDFFIEGNNILNFRITESTAGGSFNSDNLFYSRRIGRNPQYYPELADNQFADQPDNTRILGAAKLTGKNKNGLSWGLLESITAREKAETDDSGTRDKVTVEPFTNYLVGRIQQDIDDGNTIIGGMFTATNRSIKDAHLEFLHSDAYSGGLDFRHHWKDRTYYFQFNGVMSHVQGSEESILETQTSSERFFQRPDANHVSVDSTATSLTGTGGTFKAGKRSGKIVFETGATFRTPELELNDIGFLRSADQINQWTWAQYRILKPVAIFRSIRVNANQYLHWDFRGVNTYKGLNFNGHLQFKNFWGFSTGISFDGKTISNADLRGGPSITYPGGFNHWYWIGTDNRKKFRVSFNQWNYWGSESYIRNGGYWLNFTFRPIDALNISLSPSFSFNDNEQQYIQTIDYNNESRYITAKINQNTYRLELRLNYVINPNLTIQYWGQPFISRGEYNQINRITDPGAGKYEDRFHRFNSNEINYDAENQEYLIDEDSDGVTDYTLSNPNFNFVQFRSNMVLRWEYVPGSTLFLVWTQSRTGNIDIESDNSFSGLSRGLFDEHANNIFLLKFTYRFRF